MAGITGVKSSRIISATPFYYGWVIVAVGTLSTVMMGPSQTFTVSIFIDYLISDLHISRSTISFTYGLATLSASLFLPLTGRLVDRHGTRGIVLLVTVGLGLACFWMGWVQGLVATFAGMLALRFFGFGSLQLVANNLIAQWFVRRRGLVMGISGLSLPIGLIIFPVITQTLINQLGWRGAWLGLGLLVLVVMLPVGWFLFKDRPEQFGLHPDGELPAKDGSGVLFAPEESWTLREAYRTGAFWIFFMALSAMTMIMAGLIFHHVSLFEQQGLSRQTAIAAFNVIALFSAISNIGMGRLLDKYSARLLLSVTMLLLVVTMISVQMMAAPWQAFLYAALQGLMGGTYRVMDSTVWAKYFGRVHLGSIRGATMIGIIGATSVGPYVLGVSMDYLGSYYPILTGLMVVPLALAVLALFVKRPERASPAAPTFTPVDF